MPKGIWSISPFLYKHSLSILVMICFVITVFIVAKSNMFKKKAKIRKFNWWDEDEDESQRFFESLFYKQMGEFDEIHIYSVMKELKPFVKTKNILYVQYSGEPEYHNPELFDINIIPGDHSQPNVLSIPYMLGPLIHRNVKLEMFTQPRKLNHVKDKFCLFAVSNPKNEKRNHFFQMLSQYKKVDSCGKFMNNLGMRCPGKTHLSPEFLYFISNYKFMICFENSSLKHYLTEKLFNAYSNGTIPIYWGCPNIDEYVNLSSILYLKPDYSQNDVDELIRTIIMLDNDDIMYKKKYESVFFKDGRIPDQFNVDYLREKVDEAIQKL